MNSIKFKNQELFYLDQTKLPHKEYWRKCRSLKSGYKAIKELQVRGAPLIGVFAAYCFCIHLGGLSDKKNLFFRQAEEAFAYLKASRPTAVNLFWALERLAGVISANQQKTVKQIKKMLVKAAKLIHREDIIICRKLSGYGAGLIKTGDGILTHCNAGFLATSGQGTALGVIYEARRQGKKIKVYADETRPLLQGSRLTAWELEKKRIKSFIITDNTAAYLMQKKQIDKIIVGADRITSSGDTANKIGTYNLAVLADYHKIPFYVAAPFSTFDLNISRGQNIAIEQRDEWEVKKILGKLLVCPKGAEAINYAFDVTPPELITAIITDKGIVRPPYKRSIKKIIGW